MDVGTVDGPGKERQDTWTWLSIRLTDCVNRITIVDVDELSSCSDLQNIFL
jgi:hypothetical protein